MSENEDLITPQWATKSGGSVAAWGVTLLATGLIAIVFAWFMNIAVATSDFEGLSSVANAAKMHERTFVLICGATSFVAGAILFAVGRVIMFLDDRLPEADEESS